MRIIYKFPSRNRPYRFFAHLDNIIAYAKHDDYIIVPTLDSNDYIMINEQVREKLLSYINTGRVVSPIWGKSVSKVHAVNRDMPTTDWDIVVATSDDMEYTEPGFDLKIIKEFETHFPDTDGILHYKDGYEHGDILSLPIIGKKYYDRTGYIYFPGYQSLYCDEEAIIVGRRLGKCISLDYPIVKHNHPMNKAGIPTDDLYRRNDKFYYIDKALFERRKQRNFGL